MVVVVTRAIISYGRPFPINYRHQSITSLKQHCSYAQIAFPVLFCSCWPPLYFFSFFDQHRTRFIVDAFPAFSSKFNSTTMLQLLCSKLRSATYIRSASRFRDSCASHAGRSITLHLHLAMRTSSNVEQNNTNSPLCAKYRRDKSRNLYT